MSRALRVLTSERSLLAIAALLLAAALFGPSVPAQRAQPEHLVVLDITQSMNVPDMALGARPASRLAAAKAMLAQAIGELACGSKVGLGVFSEYRAFVLLAPVEVCANRSELLATLAQLDGRIAWTGNSEVAKGLNSSLRAARELAGPPAVVFVSDGHEAPPLDPNHRPAFDDALVAGQGKKGLIVGVGGDVPLPIPKTDPAGRPLGHWRANEVLQTDPRSRGRGGSIAGEAMADDGRTGAPPLPGAAPGREHLSSLREGYLQLLAGETGLRYHRLRDAESLHSALIDPLLTTPRPVLLDLRPWLGAGALLALLCAVGRPRIMALG